MNCPQCRQILRDGARFCDDCGYRVSSPDATAELKETDDALASHEVDPLVGRTLDGKYELTARLGEGGMGTVYRARRTHIGDEVAVKVLHSIYTRDASILERFRREARAAAQLQHPNVVAIYDLSEARDRESPSYIVMELVKGESLRDILRGEEKLEVHRAVSLMRSICAGVGAAHRHGITHRDLKPDNIMVIAPDEDDERERVKVLDFGIAKLRDAAGVTTLTQTGAVMGTPYYMSPEQCRGETLDARADIYSLGTILYEMLAGRPPFMAQSVTGIITKHLIEPPPALPRDLKVVLEIEAIIHRALAKDSAERQADAISFSRELQEAMKTQVAPPVPATDSTSYINTPVVSHQSNRATLEQPLAKERASVNRRPAERVSLTSLGLATNENKPKHRAGVLWLGIGGVAAIVVLALIIVAAMQWRGGMATSTEESTNRVMNTREATNRATNTTIATQESLLSEPAQSTITDFQIQVTARGEPVWISARVDDENPFEIALAPNEEARFTPERRLSLRYPRSKATALQVTINGRPVRVPSNSNSQRNTVEMVINENYEQLLQ